MPTGSYKRTKFHKKRQEEGWAKSKYVHTPEHREKISKAVKAWWDGDRIKHSCPTCGQRIQYENNTNN